MLRLALILVCIAFTAHAEPSRPTTFAELGARPQPKSDVRIAYGTDPLQFGELWLPKVEKRPGLLVLIHGGCWQSTLPGLELTNYMADDLRGRGFTVWNIEYRRLGHDGGGYPGTYRDVAAAIDLLRTIAPQHNLDLTKVVTVGHSAGGHLAAWAAGRDALPDSSPLYTARPLPIAGVVSLAGVADLEAFAVDGPACGGPKIIASITGKADRPGVDVYGDTAPARFMPKDVMQIMISGAADAIVPARFGETYKKKMPGVQHIVLKDAGHFEVIDPTWSGWRQVLDAIERVLG